HRSGRGFGNEAPHGCLPDITYRPEEVIVPDFLPDIPEVRQELAEYYQAVSRYDQEVGEELKALEENGRADAILGIVTSDNGMPFPGSKASSFDSGLLCPFILATPELQRSGHHCRVVINWANIAPTILDWCGVAADWQPPEGSPTPPPMPER